MSTSQRKNHLIIHISETDTPLEYAVTDNNVYIYIKCNAESVNTDQLKCLTITQIPDNYINISSSMESIVTVLTEIINAEYENFFKIILYGENNKIIAEIFNTYINTLQDDNTVLSKITHKNNNSTSEVTLSRDDITKEVEKKLENHNNLMKLDFNMDKYNNYLTTVLSTSRVHTGGMQEQNHDPAIVTPNPAIVTPNPTPNPTPTIVAPPNISDSVTPKIINKIYIIYMTDDITTSKHGFILSKKKLKLRKIRNIYKIPNNAEKTIKLPRYGESIKKTSKQVFEGPNGEFLYTIKDIPVAIVTKLIEIWWYKEYTKVPKCANGRLKQFTGTCWFNSVINLLLLTPQLAKMLINTYNTMYPANITDQNIIESKKRVEFDFNTIDFGKNEINKTSKSNGVETVSNIVFLHDENNKPYTVPENLYVLVYNLLINQNKPATKSNFMTVIANGIVINGISNRFKNDHNSKQKNAEGGHSHILLRFLFDTLFLSDTDPIENEYIKSSKENSIFDILFLTHNTEYNNISTISNELKLNDNIESILFKYYLLLNKEDKERIDILKEILTSNTESIKVIKELNESFIRYVKTLSTKTDEEIKSNLLKFGIVPTPDQITNIKNNTITDIITFSNLAELIDKSVVKIAKDETNHNFVIDKNFIDKYSLYNYNQTSSKDRNIIILYYKFGYYDSIPDTLTYLDQDYKLSGSIIRPFNGHVIAGLKCYGKSYVFDANNIITECDWHNKNSGTYYEEASLVYSNNLNSDLYKFDTYILIYIKDTLTDGFYGGSNYMYDQLQYKNKYLKYKNKYLNLKI